jgi:hypothetical protein
MAPNFNKAQRQMIFDAMVKHHDECKYKTRSLSKIIAAELKQQGFVVSQGCVQTYIHRYGGAVRANNPLFTTEYLQAQIVGDWEYHQ